MAESDENKFVGNEFLPLLATAALLCAFVIPMASRLRASNPLLAAVLLIAVFGITGVITFRFIIQGITIRRDELRKPVRIAIFVLVAVIFILIGVLIYGRPPAGPEPNPRGRAGLSI